MDIFSILTMIGRACPVSLWNECHGRRPDKSIGRPPRKDPGKADIEHVERGTAWSGSNCSHSVIVGYDGYGGRFCKLRIMTLQRAVGIIMERISVRRSPPGF